MAYWRIRDGVAVERFEQIVDDKGRPTFHENFLAHVQDDKGQPVAIGWKFKDGVFSAPTNQRSKGELVLYADEQVEEKLARAHPYKIDGLGSPMSSIGPFVRGAVSDDANGKSLRDLYLRLPMLSYPFVYVDENYTAWSLTQAQLKQFIEAVLAHADDVWRFYAATLMPAIARGDITSYEQIDTLQWPGHDWEVVGGKGNMVA